MVVESGSPARIRINPAMIHPIQLIGYAMMRIQCVHQWGEEDLDIAVVRVQEYLTYRIRLRTGLSTEKDAPVLYLDISDVQSGTNLIRRAYPLGPDMYEAAVATYVKSAPSVQTDGFIPENIHHDIFIGSRVILIGLRINVILQDFLVGDNPYTVLIR